MENFNEDKIKQLLAKHLMKELTEDEALALEQWRKLSLQNEELYRRMADSLYLQKRYSDFSQVVSKTDTRNAKGKRLWFWWSFAAAAAAVIVATLLIPKLLQPEIKSITAPEKGICSLQLPDGSKVWLKSASSISYPSKFKSKKREVALSGEGYFEVAPSSAPFVVEADGFKVKVTGTKFDVISHRNEKEAFMALIEGEVIMIYSDSSGVVREERMVGGELAVFNKALRSNTIVKANTSIYSSWIEGVYYFESEKLENILREVCRYYGYNLIISEKSVTEKVLSGRLKMGDDAKSIIGVFQEFFPGHITLEAETIIVQ